MTQMKSMFDGILPSDESVLVPVSVTLNIPYLGTTYSNVDSEHVNKLLGTSLSILLSRHTDKPLDKTQSKRNVFGGIKIDSQEAIEKFIDETDDYELAMRETAVMGIVDWDEISIGIEALDPEYEKWRIETEEKYEKIIDETIELFNEYLIINPLIDMETQMEILMSCFDNAGEIIVRSQNYYDESSLLWLSIAG